MKTVFAAAALLAGLTTAQAQERQAAPSAGSAATELSASALPNNASTTSDAVESATPRKIRVVLPSPYGN